MRSSAIESYERSGGRGYRVLLAEVRRDVRSETIHEARRSEVLTECHCCAGDFEIEFAERGQDDEWNDLLVAHELSVVVAIDGIVQDEYSEAICCRCADEWELATEELRKARAA